MDREESDVVRRYLLKILDAARFSDGEDTYREEGIIQSQLRKMGVGRVLTDLRGELFYLYDKGLVKFHKTRVGREDFYAWRITAEGVDVYEGSKTVPGVQRA